MGKDIFCKIVSGEIPAYKIYEDSQFLAFLDVNPIQLGHTLLIPKEHCEYIFDMPELQYSALLSKAKELAPAIQEATGSRRVGIAVEGFGVPHVHVHLVPISEVNGLDPNKQHSETQEKLTEMAKNIKSKLLSQ